LHRWEDDGGVPAQEGPPVDYSEPPTLRRKDFWSEYGPVRYWREYSGSPPIKRFREFFPWDKIGELALRPEIESRVKRLRAGDSWLRKCALGYDWEAERLFALADARRKIEGQKLPTVLHAFAFAAYEVEDAINSLHPSLPAAATADFFQSYDLYRHLCCFAYCLGEYGLRLGRSPGVWEEEVFRGLLCIWDQLGDYANKLRSAMVARTDPETKDETECEQHAGRDARATPEAPVALLPELETKSLLAEHVAEAGAEPAVSAPGTTPATASEKIEAMPGSHAYHEQGVQKVEQHFGHDDAPPFKEFYSKIKPCVTHSEFAAWKRNDPLKCGRKKWAALDKAANDLV
jgi:hypothetical protein